ncbi:hypothetical protein WBP07_21265 (plasmid) [Novosphingobium sp. BL-8A]|uniref:hypothetical protein n=1 Tax=Novosphingobium sp. BL-8A TaxID=3127639 RepID=UPI0037578CB3
MGVFTGLRIKRSCIAGPPPVLKRATSFAESAGWRNIAPGTSCRQTIRWLQHYSEQRRNFAKASGFGGRASAEVPSKTAVPKAAAAAKIAADSKAASSPKTAAAGAKAVTANEKNTKQATSKTGTNAGKSASKNAPLTKVKTATGDAANKPGAANATVETSPAVSRAAKPSIAASVKSKAPVQRGTVSKPGKKEKAQSATTTALRGDKSLGTKVPAAVSDVKTAQQAKVATVMKKTPATAGKAIAAQKPAGDANTRSRATKDSISS